MTEELVILERNGAYGDVIMTLPAVKLLRKKLSKDIKLVYITKCPEVLENNPDLDYILNSRNNFKLPSGKILEYTKLNYENYGMENAIETMIKQVGCEITTDDDLVPELYCEKRTGYLDEIIAMKDMHKLVVLHTGRSWRNRELSIAKWIPVVDYLKQKNYYVVEVGNMDTLTTGLGLNLCGLLSIQNLVYLVKNADLFLGIDSLVSNIAQAEKIKGVVVFGCVLPHTRLIKNSSLTAVHLSYLDCAGCRNRTNDTFIQCSKDRIYCGEDITVDMILKKLNEVIN